MTLVETAHIAELERTVNALQAGGGVVLLHGVEPQAAIDLATLAVTRLPERHAVGVVDITRCQDDLAVAHALASAVAATYLGDIPTEAFLNGEWRFQRDAHLLALIETASPRFYSLLQERPKGASDPAELFEVALDAFTRRAADGPTVLVFLGADELAPTTTRRSRFAIAREFLWTLRGRLQQSIGESYVLFAGASRTAQLVADKDAAFFGWGTEVLIERLPGDRLRRHLQAALRENGERLHRWQPAEADALAMNLAGLCDGSAFLAQQLLELLPLVALERPEVPRVQEGPWIEPTVARLLNFNAGRLRSQTRFVKGLAPNALRIAIALANDERPYSVVDHPSEASRALRAMQDHAIVTQDRDSRWMLCDPLFALWLREPYAGRVRVRAGTVESIPDWTLTS